MVDAEVKAIGWTFLFDLLIFIVYVIIFFAIRTRRGDREKELLPNYKVDSTKNALITNKFSHLDLKQTLIETDSLRIDYKERDTFDGLDKFTIVDKRARALTVPMNSS